MSSLQALFLCLFITVIFASPGPHGYFRTIGIPLAKELEKSEKLRLGSRIFNGQETNLREHPYLIGVVVHMKFGGTAVATASMISPTKALYAAHCWNDGTSDFADYLTLVFGSEYLFYGGVRVDTADVDVHEQWNSVTSVNDIAIITHERVDLSDIIQPATLSLDIDYTGLWATASGYGKTGTGVVAHAMSVRKQVISDEQCKSFYGSAQSGRLICTSGAGNVMICSGDSGGPLTVKLNGENVQIGISALTVVGCQGGGWPSGFTRVASYLDWIRQRL